MERRPEAPAGLGGSGRSKPESHMNTVAGIFTSRADAGRAVERLRSGGVGEDSISLLTPDTTQGELDDAVPTTETEQPGTGSAFGGTVGGAVGAASGLGLGAALASFFVPGVGPILAAGLVGAALLGAGGVAWTLVPGRAPPA